MMSGDKLHYRRPIAIGVLALLGLTATSCARPPEYITVRECDIVDDRVTTTGSKVDAGRLLFGDGNISQVPDPKFFIHTPKFGTVEVNAQGYLGQLPGSEYCREREVQVVEEK